MGPAASLDWDYSDGSKYNLGGDHTDGVEHNIAKLLTARIVLNMLTTDCTGAGCCCDYNQYCAELSGTPPVFSSDPGPDPSHCDG